MNTRSFVRGVLITFCLTVSATATNVTIGASAPTTAFSSIFGSSLAATAPGVWTGTYFTGTANTSVINDYLDPLAGSGYYAYAEQGNSITASFAGGINSLNLLWGSPDAYNTISFYSGLNGTGTSETYSPGSGLLSSLIPSQMGGSVVSFTTTGVWESVIFASSGNTFEFAASTPTILMAPEPASMALLGGGLLAIGAGSWRRRRRS